MLLIKFLFVFVFYIFLLENIEFLFYLFIILRVFFINIYKLFANYKVLI